jgi:radical SAM/SPASM domain protein of ACGX system
MDKYFAFQWHITDSCDQRCAHCYIFSAAGNHPLRETPWEDMLSIIDDCEEMCVDLGRVPYFYITGGDPILHEDFWRLLSLFKEKRIAFSILGNPFHLNDEVCRRLKDYGCERYQLSLDGLRDTHDKIRRPGSFDATLEKIAVIRSAGIRSVIMTTVSGTNMDEIPAIIDLVAARHADVFAFARYCPTSFEKSTHIGPGEYRALLDACWNKFNEHKNSGTTFDLKDHLWTLYLHDKGLFRIPAGLDSQTIYDGCNCGISHLTILPNGDIYACRRMESLIGNAFSDRLTDVFLGAKMDTYRNYAGLEKCSQCELLRFCRGCPAVAYGYTRNPYAADPQCWKEVV